MDIVVKYAEEFNADRKAIFTLNQTRIHKKIILPCELVGFLGKRKTKEAREEKEISSAL